MAELKLNKVGMDIKGTVLRNLSMERLVEEEVLNEEAHISMNGATMVDTGSYTGRSPNDKYFVDEPSSSDNLWWGPVNKKVKEEIFNELYEKVVRYYNSDSNKTYIFDGYAGADLDYQLPIRIIAKKHGKHILQIICL